MTLVVPAVTRAGDIADDVRGSAASDMNADGGFAEIGLTTTLARRAWDRASTEEGTEVGIGLTLSASYRRRGFFIEATSGGFDGLNAGYTLHDGPRWTLDFLAANIAGEIDTDNDTPPPTASDAERERALRERDTLFIAAGLRLTGHFGDTITQFRLVSDWHEGNGLIGSARLGRQWQLGNWNLHGVAGVRYQSARMADHWFGIDAAEATRRLPAFDARASVVLESELGASYPLTRDWVFRSTLRYRDYPDAVSDSPLVSGSRDVTLSGGVSYVF